MLDRWRKKGDCAAADVMQAELGGLLPEVRDRLESRQTIWWRTLLLDPRQKVDDVSFLLALILLQEDMAPTSELAPTTVDYVKRLAGGVSDGVAYLILQDLRRNFTEPEDFRAVFRYIWRTAKGHMDDRPGISESDKRPSHSRQRSAAHDVPPFGEELDPAHARLRKPLLGIPEPISIANAAAQLPISRDTLYDWINSGKIPARRHRGRSVFDTAGFDRVRELLHVGELRVKILDHLQRQGKMAAAAKKFLYRRRKAGVSLEDILKEVKGR
jgi:excisionase family DNA binding protein